MSTMPTPFMGTTSGLVSSKRLRVALTVGVAAAALGLSGAGAYGLTNQDSAEGDAPQRIASNATWSLEASSGAETAERVSVTGPAFSSGPVQRTARTGMSGIADVGAAEALEASRVQSPRAAAEASLTQREPAPAARQAPPAVAAPAAAEPATQATPFAPSEGTALASAAPAAPPAPVVAPPAPAPISSALNARGQAFLAALNAERSAAGLPTLAEAGDLNAVASARAWDMVSNGYFAHVSPTGASWLTALQDHGIRVSGGGENLARVSGDVTRSVSIAVEHLMESPTHRANILAEFFDEIGVAAMTTDDGVTVFVTIFATR